MKRTPIKRKTPMKRGTLKRRGRAGGWKTRGAEDTFRRKVLERAGGVCERCGRRPSGSEADHLQAHHLVPRSRAVGQPWKHDADRNGAALCNRCHDDVHTRSPDDVHVWIRSEPRP